MIVPILVAAVGMKFASEKDALRCDFCYALLDNYRIKKILSLPWNILQSISIIFDRYDVIRRPSVTIGRIV